MTQEPAEQFVQQYEALCLKVLSDCQIFDRNPDYEDYLQILRITLFENHQRFEGEDAQVTLIYRFLRWRLRDAQRKQQRQQKILERVKSYQQEHLMINDDPLESTEHLARLWPKLSLGEQRFLYSRLYHGLTYQQIRTYYQVSAGTVCNWKKRLIQHWSEDDEAS
ncbi:sigma-70 family RNA polymerase sigma factor [Enterococcus hermanniensis]|uniref:Sigma-70 family RNA polymerase sigma factor n=1 Tax=Enterococcus hermanniensis TaxID=249189 RepID=A0A1L8TS06_9ENTE|nr:sigma-70 family RNA polymerase sigma factor [Enterococcus hermanniensis]OJG47067.1 hypothetical protein RV04_GL000314 [Enterococcus hermanniensis]